MQSIKERRKVNARQVAKVTEALVACTDERKAATPSEWYRLTLRVEELLDVLSDLIFMRDLLDDL
ncbi:hypothetical protein [Kineococcus sp. NPDC059986]|uniref:hypothetical protein n=1 Tax=Kineococcus sp. NPDC059986 TaxID=3155538 RepID=UPI00344E8F55